MNLRDIEKYWLESSEDAFNTARTLFENGKYEHSMFFLHLSLEKMLKALFINHNVEEPPFGHNLQNIASRIREVDFDKQKMELLAQITTFNIAARYDDYMLNFQKICDANFAEKFLKVGKEMIEWLKSRFKS